LTWGIITSIPIWLLIINNDGDKITLVFRLALLVGFFAIGFFVVKPLVLDKMRRIAKKMVNDNLNKDLFQTIIFEFTADGVTWTSDSSHGHSDIKSIKKVRDDKDYFYLYSSSLSAHVIPKRIFSTENELKGFELIIKTTANTVLMQ
jgi:hypothetical protein